MTRSVLALSIALSIGLPLLAPPAAAQEPDELTRLIDTLTVLWQRGDASRLVQLGAGTGLELEVQGHAMGPLTGRRAAAALRHMFAAQRTVGVRSDDPSRVAGTDDRAFVEMIWDVRPAGAPVSERNTVFIGFIREGTRWRISQIRILP